MTRWKPELNKTFTAFGIIFVSSFGVLYAAIRDVYSRNDRIIESRRRINQATLEGAGKEQCKVWYYTDDFKEYRKKKDAEEAERKRKLAEEAKRKGQLAEA